MDNTNLNSPVVFPDFLLSGSEPPLPRITPGSQFEPRKTTNKPKRILLIDDEAAITESLTEILNGAGYEALAFQDGYAAIESARHLCPDIVLSDVVMPKLNGVETVIMIRQICAATRIVLFSGQSGTADILQKARSKGHEFELLPKPIHPDDLLKRLSALR